MRRTSARPHATPPKPPNLPPITHQRRAARNRARVTPSLIRYTPTGERRATAPAITPSSHLPSHTPLARRARPRAASRHTPASPLRAAPVLPPATAGTAGGLPAPITTSTTYIPRHTPRVGEAGVRWVTSRLPLDPTLAGGVARRCGDYHIARHPRVLSASRRPGAVSATTAARRQLPHRLPRDPAQSESGVPGTAPHTRATV